MRSVIVFMLLFLLGVLPIAAQEEQPLRVTDISWSPDGMLLAVATSQGVIVYKQSADGLKRLWSEALSHWTTVVIFDPSGDKIVGGTQPPYNQAGGGIVYIWNSRTGDLLTHFEGNEVGVYSLAFNSDATQLAIGGGNWFAPGFVSYVKVWDVAGNFEIRSRRINAHGGIIHAVAYSPDGRWFAYSPEDGAITFLDAATWTPLAAIYEATEQISFDPTENPSAHVWLGQGRTEEWEFRETPEIHLVRIVPTQYMVEMFGALPASNEARRIGGTETASISVTNDGVLRTHVSDQPNADFTHVNDRVYFRKGVFNPQEKQVALIGEPYLDGSYTPSSRSTVYVWTLDSGAFDTLDLNP